jgi:hypothetical protein
LVKIEGTVWYTIYHHFHHLPVVKGVNKPLYYSPNQWEKDIYEAIGSAGSESRRFDPPWEAMALSATCRRNKALCRDLHVRSDGRTKKNGRPI